MNSETSYRCVRLVLGFLLFAAGIVLLVGSGLGASPWDVLHTGVQNRTPWTLGTVIVGSAVIVCAVAAGLGVRPGPGTVADVLLVGLFVDLLHPLIGPVAHLAIRVLAPELTSRPVVSFAGGKRPH